MAPVSHKLLCGSTPVRSCSSFPGAERTSTPHPLLQLRLTHPYTTPPEPPTPPTATRAGTGNDPRNRQFKTVSQGEVYDPEATLIQAWVPELAHLPAALAHRPWEVAEGSAEAGEQGAGSPEGAGCARGAGSYPTPMVDPQTQVRRDRRLAGKKTG